MGPDIAAFLYLIAGVCFILALKGLASAKTARNGNLFGMVGMAIATGTTMQLPAVAEYSWIVLGLVVGGVTGIIIAKRIEMTALPQLVAAFHSLVGLAAVFVAAAALLQPEAFGITSNGAVKTSSLIEMALGTAIGAITFTGSVIAFAKLHGLMTGKPLIFPMQHLLNAAIGVVIVLVTLLFVTTESHLAFWILVLLSFAIGFLLILPIGGADMPVVISMLNSYSGWAAAGIGFTLENNMLIVTGALVGSSGAILSYIMCKAMNRSIIHVLLGGFGGEAAIAGGATGVSKEAKPVTAGSAEDAAFILQNCESLIIVPGYGMAVAQAQHALREMSDLLKEAGIKVRYAIHPVAGRMPGHMNVLLAEANVPYDEVFELDEINRDFQTTDVALVIGANDITNPLAKIDPTSSIYGMPVFDIDKAKTVLFVKRSLSPGYAGVDNELFYRDNTLMLFGDAKKMCEDILKSMD
ncbi:MAG: NAD(P)(+) transhydrogenase (Re/Si-specific) subunit beta [Pseudomonadota bacterium]